MKARVRPGAVITHRDRLPSTSRYELLLKIASGGMATVYVGRLSSAFGVSRLVAIKRAHAHLLEEPGFRDLLAREARLAARIHHPNVVGVHTVEEMDGELLLVMDYVEGASLFELSGEELPSGVALRILLDVCTGLHAAHELTGDDGAPLGIVHRDISPHNILVGVDGATRLADFGIAKSTSHTAGRTSTGALKGKVGYMAPEYVEHGHLDARSDVFALAVVAWEALAGRRLFRAETEIESLRLVLTADVPRLSSVAPRTGPALDAVLARALARDPSRRFASAAAFGDALENVARRAGMLGSQRDVGAFVKRAAGDALASRRALLRESTAEASGMHLRPADACDEALGRIDATASIVGPVPAALPSAPPIAVLAEGTPTAPRFAHAHEETALAGAAEPPADEARTSVRGWIVLLVAAAITVGVSVLVTRARGGADEAPAAPSAPAASIPSEPAAPERAGDEPAPPEPAGAARESASAPVDAPRVADPRGKPEGRPRPATRSRPRPPAPASAVAAPATTPEAPTSKPTGDKAPPNPYGP